MSVIVPKFDWVVMAEGARGWFVAAQLTNEADAYEYGAKHLRALVYENGECIGFRRDRAWCKPPPDAPELPDL